MSRAFVVVALLFGAAPVRAQSPSIEHQAVGCVVAEKFPRFDARFSPADEIGAARVLFQPEGSQQWYAVTMKAEGPGFVGVLPKPKKSLPAFHYYIEVTDKAMATNRTPDYTANVVGSAAECRGKLVAGALGSAAVLLQVPAGAAALPAGFASAGVVAAGSGTAGAAAGAAGASSGGGLGTGAIIAGVSVAAAGAAVAVVASGKDHGPGSTNLTGPINGQWVITQTVVSQTPVTVTNVCVYTNSLNGTGNMRLEQSNGTVSGNFSVMMTSSQSSASAANCGQGPGGAPYGSCDFSGSPSGFSCNFQNTNASGAVTSVYSMAFSGSLSGSTVSGSVDFGLTGQGSGPNFTQQFSGSTRIPVTLR